MILVRWWGVEKRKVVRKWKVEIVRNLIVLGI